MHQNLSDASLDRRAAMFEMLKPCFSKIKRHLNFMFICLCITLCRGDSV